MALTRCTFQDHALTVLAVAILSAGFGTAMELNQASKAPIALNAPKGNDLKGLRIVPSANWGHVLIGSSDFAR